MSTDPFDEMIHPTDIASAATGTSWHPTFPPGQKPAKMNYQLSEWLEAKRLFAAASNQPSVNPGDLVPIVNRVGNSLAALFGQKFTASGDAPSLFNYIEKYLPSLGWNLKTDDPVLHQDFLLLDEDYKDLTKHPSAGKVSDISRITFDRTRRHMETGRRLWLWYLGKRGNSQVPADQKLHFQDIR